MTDVPPRLVPKRVGSNYQALSRPHVAEELDRIVGRIEAAHKHQGSGLGVTAIHLHTIRDMGLVPFGPMCTEDCLLVDSVTADTPEDIYEVDRVAFG